MPWRQVTLFRIGCWSAILTAFVHLAGHIIGPPPPGTDEARMIADVAHSAQFELPGGSRRTIVELLDGFSLAFAALLATLGAAGVIVHKRAGDDAMLLQSVARVFAVCLAGLLVISMLKWFIVPTVLIAFVAVAFALASVRQPA
jgi:hypothetical protein